MKFYKMISGENFVGIGTSLDLRRFQLKHKVVLACDESNAQYIQYKDNLYRAAWMVPVNNELVGYSLLEVIEIDKKEYEILLASIEAGEEIETSPEVEENLPEQEIELMPNEKVTIEFVRNAKIKEMSNRCNKEITSGFNVVLSDGLSHHFDLTLEDQLNLFDVATAIENGEDKIAYHASGEMSKFYSAEEMTKIIEAASELKQYHTAYFNSLKGYINSLTDMGEVAAIEYGVVVPDEYTSEVLKAIIERE